MPTLRFVTGNAGKAREAAALFEPLGYDVEQVKADVVEVQADDLATVARAKVESAAASVAPPFFLDDAGLFVKALNGFPGVYSAHALATLGNAGILKLLEGATDRAARFEAVIGYRDADGRDHFFRGVCRGHIAPAAATGEHGFGFDPIFVPEGREETFAELPADEKNAISHRGRALADFREHLEGATPD